jgi:hypothetical protein
MISMNYLRETIIFSIISNRCLTALSARISRELRIVDVVIAGIDFGTIPAASHTRFNRIELDMVFRARPRIPGREVTYYFFAQLLLWEINDLSDGMNDQGGILKARSYPVKDKAIFADAGNSGV